MDDHRAGNRGKIPIPGEQDSPGNRRNSAIPGSFVPANNQLIKPEEVAEFMKPKTGYYSYWEKIGNYEYEVVFATHAELVAFINWSKQTSREPLQAIEPERPAIF